VTDASDAHDDEARDRADAVYDALIARVGEGSPRPRLAPTRRTVELLGDPHRAAPVIHITGTNGKTSTSRMIESLLRASGLRTGLLTSPHLERFTERIRIDGAPITDEAVARNWDEILPFLAIVDVELEDAGDEPLTYFEALTVLAFACFADAPVDVVVLEVGMGGEWDSTNVADGQVAVFTPIDLDHQSRLGNTIVEIARTKSGIIKPMAAVVSAKQRAESLEVLEEAAELTESTLAVEGDAFDVLDEYFDFDDIVFVFGVLADKDADGIVEELARANGTFIVTTSHSERARDVHELAGIVATHVGADRVQAVARLDDALDEARAWAADAPKRAVVVTGSIVLVGEAMSIASDRGWGRV
jgi:folylpolyglutamate synthase/dihydropteroate synthase